MCHIVLTNLFSRKNKLVFNHYVNKLNYFKNIYLNQG